jgi:hypothetical protein
MKNKLIKLFTNVSTSLLIIFIGLGTLYLLGSFISWNFNIANWHFLTRLVITGFSIPIIFFALIVDN